MIKGKRKRIVQNINLNWKFHRGDEPEAWYKGFIDDNWCNVTLPHDWSVKEPFSKDNSSGTGYLPGGTGWYRKAFNLPKNLAGKKVYITFEGVYNNSQVWCNSYYIGKRPYGYSTFTYDITPFVSFGEAANLLAVKVNHKDIADSRWFTGTGIYRDVYITITHPIHIKQYGVFVTTSRVTGTKAGVTVKAAVLNETNGRIKVTVKNTIYNKDGEWAGSAQETFDLDKSLETEQTIQVDNPEMWSPDNPYLYSIVTEIIKDGEVADDLETAFGIRWFRFDPDKGFFLNDTGVKIKGVCIHHDAGCLGAAVPKKVWERRLAALKAMGCNAIRMSHNPPSPSLLDLCDSMGFLVIDEAFDEWEGVKNKWWQGHNVYPPKHYGYFEDFPQWHETDIKEMVLRDRNHPCVIMWSIGNEVDYPNDPYCHPGFNIMTGNNDTNKPAQERVYDPNKPNAERLVTIAKRLVKYVKECDTTRPVTAALAYPELSNLTGYTDCLDIAGYNYKEHLYEQDHRKYPDRVIYGSENWANADQWLEIKDKEYICAQFIWTGIDYLGEAKGWPVRISPAGFLDLAGYKKTGYYYRQSLWHKEPMVYLAVKNGKESAEASHWNWEEGERVQVFCYTNCKDAELFLNGYSLGIKRLRDYPKLVIVWDTVFQEGTLKAIARDCEGNAYTCELVTAGGAEKIMMCIKEQQLEADGQDIAHIEIKVTDREGNLTFLAENSIQLSVEGPGEILGMENGNPEDLEPYCSKNRKVYQGKLLAYIRTTTTPGTIKITAVSQGLRSADGTIEAIKVQKQGSKLNLDIKQKN